MNETRVAYFRGRCPLLSPAAHGLVAFAWLDASRMPGLRRSRDRDWALPPTIPRGIRREVGTERHFSAAQDNFPRMLERLVCNFAFLHTARPVARRLTGSWD